MSRAERAGGGKAGGGEPAKATGRAERQPARTLKKEEPAELNKTAILYKGRGDLVPPRIRR